MNQNNLPGRNPNPAREINLSGEDFQQSAMPPGASFITTVTHRREFLMGGKPQRYGKTGKPKHSGFVIVSLALMGLFVLMVLLGLIINAAAEAEKESQPIKLKVVDGDDDKLMLLLSEGWMIVDLHTSSEYRRVTEYSFGEEPKTTNKAVDVDTYTLRRK